jgi:predicted ABC-type ATPase
LAKNVYVIAGPNGAGKTTFAREFLPNYAHCPNFVNADLIAQGVSPFAPQDAAIRAGRLMLAEIQRLAATGADFGFETTLSGQTQLALWNRLKARGYQIHLFYVWLSTDALAEVRVKGRVQAGGHDIPPAVIRRRFSRSVQNFFRTHRLVADSWALFDNSGDTLVFIASGKGENALIMDPAGYQRIWEAQETP